MKNAACVNTLSPIAPEDGGLCPVEAERLSLIRMDAAEVNISPEANSKNLVGLNIGNVAEMYLTATTSLIAQEQIKQSDVTAGFD